MAGSNIKCSVRDTKLNTQTSRSNICHQERLMLTDQSGSVGNEGSSACCMAPLDLRRRFFFPLHCIYLYPKTGNQIIINSGFNHFEISSINSTDFVTIGARNITTNLKSIRLDCLRHRVIYNLNFQIGHVCCT